MRNARFEQAAALRQTSSQSQIAIGRLTPVHALRLYSAESAAAQTNRKDEFAAVDSADVTRFSELPKLGVNEGLVRALTQGMRYENMTEVQSMTINSALKGVDM